MIRGTLRTVILTVGALVGICALVSADSVTLIADRNSTLIEPSPGEASLGAAQQFHTGTT